MLHVVLPKLGDHNPVLTNFAKQTTGANENLLSYYIYILYISEFSSAAFVFETEQTLDFFFFVTVYLSNHKWTNAIPTLKSHVNKPYIVCQVQAWDLFSTFLTRMTFERQTITLFLTADSALF